MLLGALLDAGADVERVRAVIASLGVPGLGLRTEPARRGGLACLRAVITTPTVADRERHLADVLGHVGGSDLHPAGKGLATRVFRLLAEAEGAVHGEPPEDVHFHEVGAFDSMADVVGSAAALEDLGLLRPGAVVCCSALAAGSGFVNSRHGRLPVPAPAVLRIAAAAGLDLASGDLAGERTTPTGAALLAAAAVPGGFPAMTVRAVGTGGGGRDTPDRPNITRVVVGAASAAQQDLREGEVTVVESTVDDLDPRLWPSVLQAVRAAGAWDCWCTPIIGRHGRPGQVLTALCAEPVRRAVADAIFAHTGTLGVRWSRMSRLTAARRSVPVEVGPPGHRQVVTVKVAGTPGATSTPRAWPGGLRHGHGRAGRSRSRRPGPGLAGPGRLRSRRRPVPRPGQTDVVTLVSARWPAPGSASACSVPAPRRDSMRKTTTAARAAAPAAV